MTTPADADIDALSQADVQPAAQPRAVAKAGALAALLPLVVFAVLAALFNKGGVSALRMSDAQSGGWMLLGWALVSAPAGAILALLIGRASGWRHRARRIGNTGGLGVWLGPLFGALAAPASLRLHSSGFGVAISYGAGIVVWTLGSILWLRSRDAEA